MHVNYTTSKPKYEYLNLEDKLIFFDKLIKEREKGLSFPKIAKPIGVNEVRIRKEYANAIKIESWKKSDLWNLLYRFTKTYPASYAVRLYGYLLTNDISTIKKFQNTSLDDIFSIKGIGVKYQETIAQMKNYIKD